MASLVGFGLLAPVLLLGLLVLAVAAVGGGRNEPDPLGERPYALYLSAVAFVSIFLALGAFAAAATTAADWAIGDDEHYIIDTNTEQFGIAGAETDFTAPDPILPNTNESDNERIRTLVIAGLVLLAAGALFVWHDGQLGEFRLAGVGPGWRTAQTAGYLICFLALLAAFGSVIFLGYAVFQVAAPGVAGVAKRKDGLQSAIVSAVITLAAGGIFAYHWQRLERRGGADRRLAEVVAPLPPPEI